MGAGESRFSGGGEGRVAGGDGRGSLRVLLLVDGPARGCEAWWSERSDPLLEVLARLNPLRFSPRVGLWHARAEAERVVDIPAHLPTVDRLGPDEQRVWGWRNLDAVRRLATLLRAEADVVLIAGSPAFLLRATCAAWLARCPRLLVDPAADARRDTKAKSSLAAACRAWLDRWTLRRASAVIASTQRRAAELVVLRGAASNSVRGHVHCIPVGVDTDRFDFRADGPFRTRRALGLNADEPLVGLAGAWAGRPQGVEFLRSLLDALLPRHPQLRVVLLASSGAADRLRSELPGALASRVLGYDAVGGDLTAAQRLSALQVVCWCEDPDEDDLLLRKIVACRVPVVGLSTDASAGACEGMGGAEQGLPCGSRPLLSAVGRFVGCPVLGTDEGRAGTEAVAACVRELLEDPARAVARGQAGRDAVVRDGSLPEMVRRYERLLEEVASRSRDAGDTTDGSGPEMMKVCPAT